MTAPDPGEAIVALDDAEIVGADPWLETRLDHPEDVAVADSSTLLAGGEDGQLYRIDLRENDVTELATTDGFVLGVEIGPDGDLYACDFQSHAVVRLPLTSTWEPGGHIEPVVSVDTSDPPWHPNYCVFDSDGRMYVTDSGDREDVAEAGGAVYVVDPDGSRRILTEALSAFPNGLALSGDESRLYVAESGTREVSAVLLDDGQAVGTEFVTDQFGMVDGLALDAEDRLYAASIGDDAVYRLTEDGAEVVVADPHGLVVGNPTNIAFGGPEMRTLYVANLGLWHVTAVEIDKLGRHPSWRL